MFANIPINTAQKVVRKSAGSVKGKAVSSAKKQERRYFANDNMRKLSSANTLKTFQTIAQMESAEERKSNKAELELEQERAAKMHDVCMKLKRNQCLRAKEYGISYEVSSPF